MINISGEEDGYRLFDLLAQNHIKVENLKL